MKKIAVAAILIFASHGAVKADDGCRSWFDGCNTHTKCPGGPEFVTAMWCGEQMPQIPQAPLAPKEPTCEWGTVAFFRRQDGSVIAPKDNREIGFCSDGSVKWRQNPRSQPR